MLLTPARMMVMTDLPEKRLDWNLKALDLAENSEDEKARKWKGGLYNEIGRTYFEQEEYQEALLMFQKALQFWEELGDVPRIGRQNGLLPRFSGS